MNEAIQLIIFMAALIGLAPLLGMYMAKVFLGEKHFMKPVFGWLEKLIYSISGIRSEEEMNWKTYTYSVLLLNMSFCFFCKCSRGTCH
jgi:K+-transporting ATPase ATPase A chain